MFSQSTQEYPLPDRRLVRRQREFQPITYLEKRRKASVLKFESYALLDDTIRLALFRRHIIQPFDDTIGVLAIHKVLTAETENSFF